ncbi:MAG: hypothetical protein NTX46_01020 [Chloroflexi bacterium]|nr:hypothetical protein [Chloroflexota bacterium]
MKKTIRLALAVAVATVMVLVCAQAALAEGTQSGIEVKGSITAIDKTAVPPTVTITTKTDSAVILKVDSNTVITKTGIGNITINDLAINDKVTANYDQTTLIASKIEVNQALGKRHSFEGTIKSLTGTSLVVTTNKGDETFQVGSATQYKVPGVKNATLSNFAVGNKVSVSTAEVTVGSTVVEMAQRLTLIPAKPIKTSRTGTVTAYTANTSITIQDKKGNSYTFIVNSNTKISLKKGVTGITVGDQVNISAQRLPSESQFTARIIRDSGVPKAKGNHQTQQTNNGVVKTNSGKGNKNK